MLSSSFKKCSYILVLGILMPVHVHAWLPSLRAFSSAVAKVAGKIARPLSPYASQGASIIAHNSGKFAFVFAALTATVGFVIGSRRKRSMQIVQQNNDYIMDNAELRSQLREFNVVADESKGIIKGLMQQKNDLEARLNEANSDLQASMQAQLIVCEQTKDAITKLTNGLNDLNRQKQLLQRDLAFSNKANDDYFIGMQERKEQVEQLTKKAESLGRELQELGRTRDLELKYFNSQVDQLKAAYKLSQEEIARLTRQNQKLNCELGNMQGEAVYNVEQLSKQVQKTQAELADLNQVLIEREGQLNEREQQLKAAQEQVRDQQEQLKHKDEDVVRYATSGSELLSERLRLNSQLLIAQEAQAKAESDLQAMTKNVKRLKYEKSKLLSNKRAVTKKVSGLQQRFDKREKNLETCMYVGNAIAVNAVKSLFEPQLVELRRQNQLADGELDRLRKELAEREKQLSGVQNTVATPQSDIEVHAPVVSVSTNHRRSMSDDAVLRADATARDVRSLAAEVGNLF